jgi:hypothetical protein
MKHESTDYFISHYWGVPPPRRYNCHPELHEGRGQAVRCYPRKKNAGDIRCHPCPIAKQAGFTQAIHMA